MIHCKIHDQHEDYIPYIYRNFLTTEETNDDKFVYLIADSKRHSIGGRYRNQYVNSPWEWLDTINLTSDIINTVKNNTCVIIIDDTQEGFKKSDVDGGIENFVKRNGLEKYPNNILYLTGNLVYGDSPYYTVLAKPYIIDVCKTVWLGDWNHGVENKIHIENFNTIVEERKKRNWEYKFVSLQQRPRDFRIELRNKLRDRYSKKESICTLKSGHAGADLTNVRGVETSPYDTVKHQEYMWWEITTEHFTKVPYAVVSETEYYGDDKRLITEKVIKNLIYPQPFVFCGSRGQVTYLQSLGFKVYDDMINHSYDLLPDDKRMGKMIEELERIIKEEPHDYAAHASYNINIIKGMDHFKEVFNRVLNIFG